MTPFITALALGLLIGAQHAFEPDHLAAIGTMLPHESSMRRAAAKGAWWGLGHGLAISAIGLPLVLLGLHVPEPLEALAEVVVAAMLIGLGARAFWRASHVLGRIRTQPKFVAQSALPVGLIHGMAGSGAAVILATTQSTSVSTALVFLLVFVLGSTLSMTAIAAFSSWPLRKLAAEPSRTPWLLRISGVLSVVIGLLWAIPHLTRWLT